MKVSYLGFRMRLFPARAPIFRPAFQWGCERGSGGRQLSKFLWQRLLARVQQYANRIRIAYVRNSKVRKTVSIQIRRGDAITLEGIGFVVGGLPKRTVTLPPRT
jgi:hypothetical protein